MKNKVLIKLFVSDLSSCYDVFIPVNEVIWKIKKMCIKSVSDLTGIPLDMDKEYLLINKVTGDIYKNNDIVIDTNIRNSTELMLIKK